MMNSSGRITKAVIPIAGLGTRLRPITSAVPKALLPVPGPNGQPIAVLHHILLEAAAGGIESAAVVISPAHERMIADYLECAHESGRIPRVELIHQASPAGFGDAVSLARAFVGNDAFAVFLGDHVYAPTGRASAFAALGDAYIAHKPEALVGVQQINADALGLVGVCGAQAYGPELYRCTRVVEKPDLDTARELDTPFPGDRWFAHCGMYVFSPLIFDMLEKARPASGELMLSDAQILLLRHAPDAYLLSEITKRAYDAGTGAGYLRAFEALQTSRDER